MEGAELSNRPNDHSPTARVRRLRDGWSDDLVTLNSAHRHLASVDIPFVCAYSGEKQHSS